MPKIVSTPVTNHLLPLPILHLLHLKQLTLPHQLLQPLPVQRQSLRLGQCLWLSPAWNPWFSLVDTHPMTLPLIGLNRRSLASLRPPPREAQFSQLCPVPMRRSMSIAFLRLEFSALHPLPALPTRKLSRASSRLRPNQVWPRLLRPNNRRSDNQLPVLRHSINRVQTDLRLLARPPVSLNIRKRRWAHVLSSSPLLPVTKPRAFGNDLMRLIALNPLSQPIHQLGQR